MGGVARWVAKHRTLARITLGVIFGCWLGMLLEMGVWLWLVVLLGVLAVFFVCLWVGSSGPYLLIAPTKALNEGCDPYPLLREAQEQLTYRNTGPNEQLLCLDQCVALRYAGEYQQALEQLNAINIDRYAGTLPTSKFVYYNNLTDLLSVMGHFSEAEIWYQKAVQIYQDLPENKAKEKLRQLVDYLTADAWFRRGDYSQAIACVNALQPKTLVERIDRAMLYARCCAAMGQPERAKEQLEFVLAYGNRLYAVTEARYMMDQIQNNKSELF